MKQDRVERVLKKLSGRGLSQMVVCDPAAIFYLTGRWVEPGERLFALYLSRKGNHRILINRLFTVPEDLGVEKIWFSDTDDSIGLLNRCIDHREALGIDKNMPARFLLPLMKLGAAVQYLESSDCVDGVRACKDEEERERMREASRLNDLAMAEFSRHVRPGMTELQLAASMEEIYRGLGAEGFSFPPLVGFGKNAAVGHHEPDNTVLRDGDCVLLDVGCRKNGYCADMTRTFFFRSVSDRHRKIYEIVRRANEAAEAMIRPGVQFREIDRAARSVIEEAGFGEQFTHRLGHSIGIEVHEVGDVSCANTEEVRPGMTFSIEPGVYVQGDVGVRIEDLVLVTETGCEVLNHFTKELTVLE
ncbi:MAG: aminopeptidase P family protein [Clostridiales bacterium]|nr:aminopeptidase P family protein [Clostridiales bacterium]